MFLLLDMLMLMVMPLLEIFVSLETMQNGAKNCSLKVCGVSCIGALRCSRNHFSVRGPAGGRPTRGYSFDF